MFMTFNRILGGGYMYAMDAANDIYLIYNCINDCQHKLLIGLNSLDSNRKLQNVCIQFLFILKIILLTPAETPANVRKVGSQLHARLNGNLLLN